MQSTKTLSFLKTKLPSLHQPLPLTNHDSKRLLDALTTSFRRQLDKEHGWLPEEATPTKASSSSSSGKASLLPPLPRPTDHHVSTILSNPLFNPTSSTTSSPITRGPLPIDPTDTQITRHNAVFDEAVRAGLMTPARAHGFLLSIENAILQSSLSSVEDGIRQASPSSRILSWLESSGRERRLTPFLANPLLIRFMLIEGLEERIWTWLYRLREKPEDTHKLWSKLLGVLVSAKSKGAVKLDGAYEAIIRGEDYFLNPKGTGFAEGMLPTWRVLSYQSTVKAWKYETPSAQLFDPYVAILEHMKTDAPLDRAHLDLYHPVHPTAERAVGLLTREVSASGDGWKKVLSTAGTLVGHVQHLMALGLDTAQHLSRAGQAAQAQQILDIVQTKIQPVYQGLQRKPVLA